MNNSKHLHTIFHERKQYLLDELMVIEVALGNAQQSGQEMDWTERLKKWRVDLQKRVEEMPER